MRQYTTLPYMLVEKLILSVYMKHYQQILRAQRHFLLSVREMLMATSSTFEIANSVINSVPVIGRLLPAKPLINNVQSLLAHSIGRMSKKLGPSSESDATLLKSRIIESIMGVVQEEIDSVPTSDSTKNRMRIEALLAVKQALVNLMDNRKTTAVDTPLADNGIRQLRRVANS